MKKELKVEISSYQTKVTYSVNGGVIDCFAKRNIYPFVYCSSLENIIKNRLKLESDLILIEKSKLEQNDDMKTSLISQTLIYSNDKS